MKRILVFIALIVLMNSCGAPKTLYYWGGEARGVTVYENLAYTDYKSQTSKATCQLVCAYEDMITKFFSELGKEMLQKELEYYPESKQFIEPLMEKLVN